MSATATKTKRERKPRTNEEAANYWADGILSNEPSPHLFVNSVHCERDTIYSFGHHFPMAVMGRDKRGRVRRVVLNSDRYPNRGYANTSWDQSNVKRAVEDRVAKASWRIQVDEIPLTRCGWTPRPLQLRPALDDLEPDPYPQIDVPPYFDARFPGPEPEDTNPEACVAGRREEYSYQQDSYLFFERDERPIDFIAKRGHGRHAARYARHAYNGVIVWISEETWTYHLNEPNVTVKRCPHCAELAERRAHWRTLMHGGYLWNPSANGTRRNRSRHFKGWKLHHELMLRFGGEQGWREARRRDVRRVRALRKRREEWEARNYVRYLSLVPLDRFLLPKLDADGYVPRGHVERVRRQRARVERQRKLEQERQRKAAERERREHAARIAAATKAWLKGLPFEVRPEVAKWCASKGLKPNEDATVTLIKAVDPGTLTSGHDFAYPVGEAVEAPDYAPTHDCGQGLHFGPTQVIANRYHHGPVTYLRCRVPLATLIPLGDKCKAQSCYVEAIDD